LTWKLPLFKIYWDQNDVEAVTEAIRSGMNWAVGPNVTEFEKKLADYIGTRYCVTFNSGTSALHAALLAHDVGQGDEVIVPSFTFIATANAPHFVGAKPVFADIEQTTFGLDPDAVAEAITRKTRAIIPVHYGGCPCQIKPLCEIAEDHRFLLIEDAAEAFGAKIKGRNIGTYGDSAVLSFCQNKIITTGEGGAVVTDSANLYEKMKLILSHGRPDTCDYFATTAVSDYIALGYNFRMSNITAALGISQINKVDSIIKLRREAARYYSGQLAIAGSGISVPEVPEDYYHVYQLFSILAENRDELMQFLEKKGIMTKIYFPPVHKTHFYNQVLGYNGSFPVTERIAEMTMSLPFYPGISTGEMDYVIQSIRDYYKGETS
jgi:perosamine synthetase